MTYRNQKTIEVTEEDAFGDLIEARDRIRRLVLEFDHERSTWGRGGTRTETPTQTRNPILAMAFIGIHDLLESGIHGWIEHTREQEGTDKPDVYTRDELVDGIGHVDGYDEGAGSEEYQRRADSIISSINMRRKRNAGE